MRRAAHRRPSMRETRPRGNTAVVFWSVGKQTLFLGSAFAALFFSLRGLSALSTVLSTLPGHSGRAALEFRPASCPPAFLTPPLSVAVYLRLYSSVFVVLVHSIRFSRLFRGTPSERPSCFVCRAARPHFSHLHFPHPRLSPPPFTHPRTLRQRRWLPPMLPTLPTVYSRQSALVASGEAAAPGQLRPPRPLQRQRSLSTGPHHASIR